jgi:cytochrome c-type biogenesis protein CcmH/NrfG
MGLFLLAEVGIRMDRLAQAESLLVRCVKLAPSFTAARFALAVALTRQEKAAESLIELRVCCWSAIRRVSDRDT